MNQVLFPVFVKLKDSGDVVRYDSIAKMKNHCEKIDVENGEYEVWDASGAHLALSVQDSSQWLRIERIPISQPEQLAKAITEFARLKDVDVDISLLRAGDFSAAFEQVTSAVEAKRKSISWWRRFTQRF
jgi:hypothetical protein